MLRIHDFHIDFQFRTNLILPRDFQMALTHPWLSPDLGVSRMDPETQWTVFRDFYRYPHVYLIALLISVATEPDRTGLKYAGTGPDRTGTGPEPGPSPVLVRFLRSFDGKNLKKLCRSA